MRRAEIIRAIAACGALSTELRKALKADAEAEYREQGTAPQWRQPGLVASASITHDTIVVVDEAAFLAYVKQERPDEIEVIEQVRPSFASAFIAKVLERGDPPCDADGRVIPGLAFRAGGQFRSVSVLPSTQTKWQLNQAAKEIVGGRRPLTLPEVADAN